jgi:hypothetical protein
MFAEIRVVNLQIFANHDQLPSLPLMQGGFANFARIPGESLQSRRSQAPARRAGARKAGGGADQP